MRRSWGYCAALALFMASIIGCVQQNTGTTASYQYIKTLEPAAPHRVYGQYPGVPDNAGIITVRVVGKGVPPAEVENQAQAQLLAERAAVLDGYRQLAEKIRGIYINAYANADNYSVDSDIIRAETNTWLRGAEVLDTQFLPSGIAQAKMRALVQLSPDRIVYINEQGARVEQVNPPSSTTNYHEAQDKPY